MNPNRFCMRILPVLPVSLVLFSCMPALQAARDQGGDQGRRADILLSAVARGSIESVNGLAVAHDFRKIYATHWTLDGGERRAGLVSYDQSNGYQSATEVFQNQDFQDYQPTLSPDGDYLFFTSTRPIDGTQQAVRQNCWYSERLDDGSWGRPKLVAGIESDSWDGHATLTRKGWLYFASERSGGFGSVDIYRARWHDGSVSNIENVSTLNSELSDQDFYLDAGERFIIMTRYDSASKDLDLFYSTRVDGEWAIPEPLTHVNTEKWELSPFFEQQSGKFLFKRAGSPGFQIARDEQLPGELRDVFPTRIGGRGR